MNQEETNIVTKDYRLSDKSVINISFSPNNPNQLQCTFYVADDEGELTSAIREQIENWEDLFRFIESGCYDLDIHPIEQEHLHDKMIDTLPPSFYGLKAEPDDEPQPSVEWEYRRPPADEHPEDKYPPNTCVIEKGSPLDQICAEDFE